MDSHNPESNEAGFRTRLVFGGSSKKTEIDTVLELQSFNLIELEAYSIDDGQNIQPLQSLKHPLGHHHGFLVPGLSLIHI